MTSQVDTVTVRSNGGPPARLLPELFEEQARRTPGAQAVVDGREELTYRQLDLMSSRLANLLREYGVGPESLVGVCLPRSVNLVVALLGIWKAGAAYVPLDPQAPVNRLAWMLGDTRAKVVVTEEALAGTVSMSGAYTLLIDAIGERLLRYPTTPPAVTRGPESVAYAIYTSGSTGQPKGVLIPHAGIANRVAWTVREHGLGPDDRVLQKTPLTFDAAGWEIFAPLVTGAPVVLAPEGAERDPATLVRAVADCGATVLQSVPSVLRLLVEAPGWERCGALRLVFSAGEPLHAELCQRLLERAGVTIWNTYGPTECSIDVTALRYDPAQRTGGVPIGRPIDNTRVAVLDPAGRPVPDGEAGELHVGGVGLARGYIGRPELTAARFVPDPAGPDGERLYRTGDLVRRGPDGILTYLGRLDHQVKVNGVRVEPGEVEAALSAHPAVVAVAVHPWTAPDGTVRLAAYVRSRRPTEPARWREFLATRLPAAYLPAVFVPMERLPLTPNGKVDRAALPPPPASDGATAPAATGTPAQRAVAAAWAELLDLDADRIGPDDDFFALGGSSLLLTRLAARLGADSGVEIPVRSLFTASTVAAQAELVGGAGEAPPPVVPEPEPVDANRPVPVPRDKPLPLSFAQQRMWIVDRMHPGSSEWVTPVFVRLPIEISRDTVREALEIVAERHEVLRTRFGFRDGEVRQIVDPPAPVELRVIEALSGSPLSLLSDEFRHGFDLATGPVWRAALARLAGQEQFLLLTVHHIACDGWSSVILGRELQEACAALHVGRRPKLAPLPVQYADHAVWQRQWLTEDVIQEQVAFWRRTLDGLSPPQLPTDRPRLAEREPRGALEVFAIPADVAGALVELGRKRRATPFATLLAAFCTLLARHSGQWDLPVGTTVAGRDAPEVQNVVGLFLNTLVMRSRLDPGLTFEGALDVVGEVCRAAFAHQDVPFERLVEELRVGRDGADTPLYQVMFDLQDEGVTGAAPDDESHRAMREVWNVARLDLTVVLQRRLDGSVLGFFEYATALFDADTIARMARHFSTLLRSIVADPTCRLDELRLLPDEERRRILAAGRGTPVARPATTVAEVFAEQVRKSPDAVALLVGEERLSYAELDARANRLARYLRGRGVGAESVVGVLLPRGADLLVAHLAAWKAEAAYVPVDPGLPAERIAYMLADSGAAAVVATTGTLPAGTDLPAVLLDRDAEEIAAQAEVAPATDPDPGHLAYVIYTSGSSGRPKGVGVEHRALLNLVLATRDETGCHGPESGWLAVATTSFDVAGNELYVPLAGGGRVVMATGSEMDDPAAQVRLIHRHGVTHVGVSPSRWRLLLDAGLDAPGLTALMGGEQCPPDLAGELRRRVRRLVNEYGPTEATVAATIWSVPHAPATMLIGGPLPNLTAYVLDEHLALAPVGVVGELYLGGQGLARGYVRQPMLTADRFVPDPYGPPGARLYRTGDRCRLLADGTLAFVGRADEQVKIRGYRVELGEVQAVLTSHPAIRSAAVVAHFRAGSQQLVAYCVAAEGVVPDPVDLTRHCRAQLPEYMVPMLYVPLDELPLTRHGKVDYAALPPLDAAPGADLPEFVPPDGPAQERIAEVWRELLGGVDVSATANFFVLGGNSLLATKVMARLQEEFDTEVPLRTIFDRPTVAGLAEAVEESIRAETDALSEAELRGAV